MSRQRTHEVSITGSSTSFELGDVRWLVQQARTLPDSTRVSVSVDRGGHQLDPGSSRLRVDVDAAPRPSGPVPR